jgi:hypothetical protein
MESTFTNLACPRLAHERCELPRSDEARNVVKKAACLSFFEGDIILDMFPCEDVRHHGHRYRISAVGAQFFFFTARVGGASLLISHAIFFLSSAYNRSTRAALEERDVLLARYVGVILCEKEKGNDECDAKPNDDAVILHSGQLLCVQITPYITRLTRHKLLYE